MVFNQKSHMKTFSVFKSGPRDTAVAGAAAGGAVRLKSSFLIYTCNYKLDRNITQKASTFKAER